MKRRDRKFIPTTRQPTPGMWGVWVSPGLFVECRNHQFGPPSRWSQWWQRRLLGWQWERVGGDRREGKPREPGPGEPVRRMTD